MNRTSRIISTIAIIAGAFAASACGASAVTTTDASIVSTISASDRSVNESPQAQGLVSGSPEDPNRAPGVVVVDGQVISCIDFMPEGEMVCDPQIQTLFEKWAPLSFDLATTIASDPAASPALSEASIERVAEASFLARLYNAGMRGDPSGFEAEVGEQPYGFAPSDAALLLWTTSKWVY